MVQVETALQKESTHLKLDDINSICSLLLQVRSCNLFISLFVILKIHMLRLSFSISGCAVSLWNEPFASHFDQSSCCCSQANEPLLCCCSLSPGRNSARNQKYVSPTLSCNIKICCACEPASVVPGTNNCYSSKGLYHHSFFSFFPFCIHNTYKCEAINFYYPLERISAKQKVQ